MIKIVNEFKLTIRFVHARGFTAGQKNCGKSGLDRTGPPGLRAFGPRGRREPWAAGCWAFGPLGRRGPWAAGRCAAGLLLAKPVFKCSWEYCIFPRAF